MNLEYLYFDLTHDKVRISNMKKFDKFVVSDCNGYVEKKHANYIIRNSHSRIGYRLKKGFKKISNIKDCLCNSRRYLYYE